MARWRAKFMEPIQLEANTLYTSFRQAETPVRHGLSLHGHQALAVDGRIQSAGEVASARHFFTPAADIKPIAAQAFVPRLEHTSVAAAKAVSGAISPMLQLIMRLPTHLSIFSSFLDVLKNFLLPHTGMLTQLASIDASGLSHLSQSLFSLNGQHALAWSIVPTHANIFQTMAFDSGNVTGLARLHLSPADSLKHSMNVSAGVDLQHPQFEQLAGSPASNEIAVNGVSNISGDALAGPGISSQAITPQLAPAERIFTSKYFESPISNQISSGTNIVASSQTIASVNVPNTSIPPSFSQQPVSNNISDTASFNQLPASNEVLDAPPLEGLHAKALSLGGTSGSHHIAHSIANSSHSAVSHSTSIQSVAHAKTQATHSIADKLIQHQHSGHDLTLASRPEPTVVSQSTSANTSYTVKSGDTLWHIAHDQLGNSMRWSDLYRINREVIGSNPGMIFPGQKFDLPGHLSDGLVAHHATAASSQIASTAQAHAMTTNAGHLHQSLPKAQPQLAHETTALNANHTHDQALLKPEANVQSVHTALTSHFKLMPDNTIVHNSPSQISMRATTNNGLSIESAHDRLLSGAGAAQANGSAHNSAISKAASNLTAGKTKSVVSFSLTPDLSCLYASK